MKAIKAIYSFFRSKYLEGKTMKSQLLALSILLATAFVQAEQIKVPSIEVLKERLKGHPNDCIDPRIVLEDSGFFAEVADKEMDSDYLAMRLRIVALMLAARNAIYTANYEFYRDDGIGSIKASSDAGILAKAHVIEYLSVKIEGYSDFRKMVFQHSVASSSESLNQYRSYVKWLYKVFFKDNLVVAIKQLEKFPSEQTSF